MKFGGVDNPSEVDFTLPEDRFNSFEKTQNFKIHLGYPKWTKKDLPGLFPKGIKDELNYCSSKFNAIELNATFYNAYSSEQIEKWKDRTGPDFKFFPKLHKYISHVKRLKDTRKSVDRFCESVWHFRDKLGSCFLQLHDNFSPENMGRLAVFLDNWPEDLPLAIEFRHNGWYHEVSTYQMLSQLFETHQITNIITDTAGRRDLLHMNPVTKNPFIRFVATGHESDFNRLDDWAIRLKNWQQKGIAGVGFFIHQNAEKESPLLSEYFTKKLKEVVNINLKTPSVIIENQNQLGLF